MYPVNKTLSSAFISAADSNWARIASSADSADCDMIFPILGTATAAKIPKITITMISSINVNPSRNFLDAYIVKLSVCSVFFIFE